MSHGACVPYTRNHGVHVPAIDVLPNDEACMNAAVWSKTTLCTCASVNGSGPHVRRTTSSFWSPTKAWAAGAPAAAASATARSASERLICGLHHRGGHG